jgi:hypothetical protein
MILRGFAVVGFAIVALAAQAADADRCAAR